MLSKESKEKARLGYQIIKDEMKAWETMLLYCKMKRNFWTRIK